MTQFCKIIGLVAINNVTIALKVIACCGVGFIIARVVAVVNTRQFAAIGSFARIIIRLHSF